MAYNRRAEDTKSTDVCTSTVQQQESMDQHHNHHHNYQQQQQQQQQQRHNTSESHHRNDGAVSASRKRKLAEGEKDNNNNKTKIKNDRKKPKTMQPNQQHPPNEIAFSDDDTDDNNNNNNNDDAHSDVSSTCTTVTVSKKKKTSTASTTNTTATATTSSAFNRLQEIEDKAPLCVLGESESNMFPRKLKFMNHTIDVMYDSRVHIWLKADDFAKALGYKNYKSAVERYVNPSFVRSFPEVLDMSRTRYGDAFRLYSVNSKTMFINEAGVLQLLLRSMISDENATKDDRGHNEHGKDESRREAAAAAAAAAAATTTGRGTKQHVKPKLSADWINYHIQPSLIAFSEAAKNGMTAKEERRLQMQIQNFN